MYVVLLRSMHALIWPPKQPHAKHNRPLFIIMIIILYFKDSYENYLSDSPHEYRLWQYYYILMPTMYHSSICT